MEFFTVYIIHFCMLQVCSVLETLEREYRRDEDWCSTEKANSTDKVTYITQLVNKHQEQKEAFLKVISTRQSIHVADLYSYRSIIGSWYSAVSNNNNNIIDNKIKIIYGKIDTPFGAISWKMFKSTVQRKGKKNGKYARVVTKGTKQNDYIIMIMQRLTLRCFKCLLVLYLYTVKLILCVKILTPYFWRSA